MPSHCPVAPKLFAALLAQGVYEAVIETAPVGGRGGALAGIGGWVGGMLGRGWCIMRGLARNAPYALRGVLRWIRVVCWMMVGFRGLGCGGLSAWGWRGWMSGTTLRAAADLGRRAIEIEINPEYCGLIRRRLAQAVLPMEG